MRACSQTYIDIVKSAAMKTTPAKIILLFFTLSLIAVGRVAAQSPLDNYIREGLKNNLVIQQKNLTLLQAQQSLQVARSYFMPSVSLLGDYISGDGGRSISIPVGD